jgi:hypothetical protein
MNARSARKKFREFLHVINFGKINLIKKFLIVNFVDAFYVTNAVISNEKFQNL